MSFKILKDAIVPGQEVWPFKSKEQKKEAYIKKHNDTVHDYINKLNIRIINSQNKKAKLIKELDELKSSIVNKKIDKNELNKIIINNQHLLKGSYILEAITEINKLGSFLHKFLTFKLPEYDQIDPDQRETDYNNYINKFMNTQDLTMYGMIWDDSFTFYTNDENKICKKSSKLIDNNYNDTIINKIISVSLSSINSDNKIYNEINTFKQISDEYLKTIIKIYDTKDKSGYYSNFYYDKYSVYKDMLEILFNFIEQGISVIKLCKHCYK